MKSTWQHPDHPGIEVPRKAATVLVLLSMGQTDLDRIAQAAGVDTDFVESVENADDESVRHLAVVGIPDDQFFQLRCEVQCPECLSRITVVPCVDCAVTARKLKKSLS